MDKKNIKRRELTKQQIDDIILPPYNYVSKRWVAYDYINELESTLKYIANMLRDLVYAIMTSYLGVKENSSNYIFI